MLWFNVRNIQHVVVLRYFQEVFSPVSGGTVTKTPCFVRFQAVNGYGLRAIPPDYPPMLCRSGYVAMSDEEA